jgi:hypothetical protein
MGDPGWFTVVGVVAVGAVARPTKIPAPVRATIKLEIAVIYAGPRSPIPARLPSFPVTPIDDSRA